MQQISYVVLSWFLALVKLCSLQLLVYRDKTVIVSGGVFNAEDQVLKIFQGVILVCKPVEF